MKTEIIRKVFLVEKRETGERCDGFLFIGLPFEEKPDKFACPVQIFPVGEKTRIFGPSEYYAVKLTLDFANLRLDALRDDFRFIEADGTEITKFSAEIPDFPDI